MAAEISSGTELSAVAIDAAGSMAAITILFCKLLIRYQLDGNHCYQKYLTIFVALNFTTY